jgi:hypothetical protein
METTPEHRSNAGATHIDPSFAQTPPHVDDHHADTVHAIDELCLATAELLGPVVDFVLLVDVDPRASATRDLLVISHDSLLQWGSSLDRRRTCTDDARHEIERAPSATSFDLITVSAAGRHA